MTARIEIGRLTATDLGKTVTLAESKITGELTGIEHYRFKSGLSRSWAWINTGTSRVISRPSDTLIDITGTPDRKENP
jgi:hypothetical protein